MSRKALQELGARKRNDRIGKRVFGPPENYEDYENEGNLEENQHPPRNIHEDDAMSESTESVESLHGNLDMEFLAEENESFEEQAQENPNMNEVNDADLSENELNEEQVAQDHEFDDGASRADGEEFLNNIIDDDEEEHENENFILDPDLLNRQPLYRGAPVTVAEKLPFIEQLKEFYKRDGFFADLQWRFNRPVPQPGFINDIYDGSLYKEWVANGFLMNPNNISFSWYTDGIPVYKSSKPNMWPLYLTINELPFEMRKKKENTILAGLWFGNKKPDANNFIYVFRESFNKLYEGVDIEIPNEEQNITVKAILLAGTCDLPAKSQFLNFTKFNGEYGCPTCFCKGESFLNPETLNSTYIYKYTNAFRLRTTEECTNFANHASSERPIMGVKGPTAFSKIMPDYIQGMGIDKMHGVDGGVVKKILTLLFDIKYRGHGFSLYKFIDIINARLLAIKPPKFLHRMPRSVHDLLNWKASELRLWFNFYSIPIFQGILRPDLFNHYLLLVVAISLLNSEAISPQSIIIAEDFLHKFVKQFEVLYGAQFCSINVHQLLHFPDCVRRLGPVWTFSCFEYESLNGQFLKLIHGTWHIDTQVVKSHVQFVKMVRFVQELPEGPVQNICLGSKYQLKINERIIDSCYSVGLYKNLQEIPFHIENAIINAGKDHYLTLFKYHRLLKAGKLYVAESYGRSLQTESCVCQYIDNHGSLKIGSIYCFVKIIDVCECRRNMCGCEALHMAIIQELIPQRSFTVNGTDKNYNTRDFLVKCILGNTINAVKVINLQCVVVKMIVDEELFVGIPVNHTELE